MAGVDTFMLTPNAAWQSGSVWNKLKHDFTTDFVLDCKLYLGASDAGADGLAFVIQNNCLGAGTSGGGLGYEFMPGSSMAVEFDTYANTGGAPFDPSYDHMAILSNGSINHASNVAGPVQIHPSFPNVEDGQWHDLLLVYDANGNTLFVFFDGFLRFSSPVNIATDILGGDPYAYWGFTAATGSLSSLHGVVVESYSALTLSDTTFCTGSTTVSLPALGMANIASSNAGAFASSVEPGAFAATNAFDGNIGTRWSSQFSDPQWIYVDLGAPTDITGVTLRWEGAYGSQYLVQTSNNLVNWTTQYTENAGNGGNDVINFTANGVRYVRMYGIQRGTPYGYSLWEFQVNQQAQYAWAPNDGSISDTTLSNPVFSPTATTIYTVDIPDECVGTTTLDFTVIIDCSALPVEFLSFEAHELENREVLLAWATASEQNNDHFVIQRSIEGSEWQDIGILAGAGTTSQTNYYVHRDSQIPERVQGLYYRIKQVDTNGDYDFSETRFVTLTTEGLPLSVHPNPSSDLINVQGIQDGAYQLYDPQGRLIERRNSNSSDQFNIQHLSPGVYTIKSGRTIVRFLKSQ